MLAQNHDFICLKGDVLIEALIKKALPFKILLTVIIYRLTKLVHSRTCFDSDSLFRRSPQYDDQEKRLF